MYRLTTAVMMIFALALGSELATAADLPSIDVPSTVVHFADLDLTRDEGAAAVYRRLKTAAATVCAQLHGRNLRSQARFTFCWQSALGTAVAKVNRPVLTQYYKAHTSDRNAAIQIAKNQQ